MAGPIDVQLRNAQSSILFMQQEHAKTLMGLHSELQKLQKKCSELTFELAMKSDNVEEEQLKEQQEKLETKLQKTEEDVQEMQKLLEEKERKIFSLEQQLKLQGKKLQTEIKQNKQKQASLNNELDQKSANIAYLTNQLHQLALVRHKAKGKDEDACSNSPRPPQRPPPSHRRRVRTPSIDSVSFLKNGKVNGTISETLSNSLDLSSQHHQRRSSPSNSRSYDERDFSAFVAKVDRATSDIEIKPAPPVLPPISPLPQENNTGRPCESYSPTHSPYYTRRGVRVSKRRESEPAEINSLAVNAVHRRKKVLHRAQQPHADSS